MKKLILLALVATTLFGCSKPGPTTEQYKDLYKTLMSYSALVDQKKFTAEEEAKLKSYLQEQDKQYDLSKAN
ncbi:MAG: hypothetical protein IKT28_02310, partial [Rikenellaceae bacterium]|nr:hypothetical protein [Rikenellaceae bacterium]